jgi:hypothetical protein
VLNCAISRMLLIFMSASFGSIVGRMAMISAVIGDALECAGHLLFMLPTQ